MNVLELLYQLLLHWKKNIAISGIFLAFSVMSAVAQNKVAFTMSKSEGCAPLTVNFSDQSAGTVTSRVWNLGSGNISNHNAAVGTNFTKAGEYNITLTVTFSNGQQESLTQQVRVYEKPFADFVAEMQESCGSSGVTFTASTLNENTTTYQWDFGDGSSSNEANPHHQYSQAGEYTVKLTASNGSACKSSFSSQITAPKSENPMAAQIVSAPSNACMETMLNFSGSVTGRDPDEYSVRWDFGDNSAAPGLYTTHRYTQAGTYAVKLIATSNNGTCSDTAIQQLTVQPKITAAFEANPLFSCTTPLNVQFVNQSTGGTNLRYEWKFGNNETSSEKDPQHNFTTAGNKNITLVVTDASGAEGCSDSVVKPQYIKIARPAANFYYAPSSGCGPLEVRFTPNIGNANAANPVTKYTWNWGDGSTTQTTNNKSIKHTYTSNGTYNITLTIETRSGCTSTSTVKKVTVTPTCTDDGVVSEGGAFITTRNCTDKYKVEFEDTSPDHTFVSWNFGDGSSDNTDNPATHTFPDSQKEWLVKLTRRNKANNQLETVSKTVVIVDEKAAFTVANRNTCTNVNIQFTTQDIDPTNIKRYVWDWGDGSPRKIINNNLQTGIYNSGNAAYRYSESGTFHPKLIIEDKLGCKDSVELDQPIVISGPSVDFTASPATSCSTPLNVSFTSTSTPNGGAPIVSWQWTFENNGKPFTTTEDSTVHHLYAHDEDYKAYSVKLKITDADGCVNELSKPNLIQVTGVEASFTGADTLICGKRTIEFNNTSFAKKATYTWHWGDGTTTETSSRGATNHTYSSEGIYTVKLVVTPTDGGCSDSLVRKDYIKIVKPRANFTIGDTLQCIPAAIAFKNTSQHALEYAWKFDNGNTYTEKNPPPQTYTTPGLHTVTVVAKGINGCADTATKTFRIKGPVATVLFSGNGGCTPYSFEAKVSGDDVETYSWDFGDGTAINPSPSDSVVSHTYTLPGNYTPSVILTNTEGCTNNLTIANPIRVGVAEASFSMDKNKLCGTGAVTFTNTSAAGSNFTEQVWDFGDGTKFTGAQPPPKQYSKAGVYEVSLTVETDFGCRDTVFADLPITVNDKPEITISGGDKACEGDSIRLEATVQSEDEITSLTWRSGNEVMGDESVLQLPLRNAGTQHISVSATTVKGCADTATQSITTHSLPVPNAGPDTVVCAGSRILLHASDGTGYSWQSTGEIENPNTAHPVIAPSRSGEYVVTVTNSFGCMQKDTVAIITEEPVNLVATTEYNICRGDKVQLTASGNASSFSWQPSTDLSGHNSSSPIAFPDSSTTYLVIGQSKNICPDDSATVRVNVLDHPTVRLGNDTTILGGVPFTLQSVATGNIQSYEWTPQNGLSCTTCPTPEALPESDQQYIVEVTTPEGCKASDTIAITLICNKQAIFIPNAFTPNGDRLNDRFYVKGFGLKTVNYLRIFDRWGKEIFNRKNFNANDEQMGWDGSLPGGNQPAGTSTYIYVAEVVCSEGVPITLRGSVTLIR